MDAVLFTSILEGTLLPFLRERYPDGHKFMQDNDTSNYAKYFITANNINWLETPPESPDLNPIENLWHELKEYLRREIKPTTKDALINGVKLFWKTVDVAKCTKYIGHLKKVIPRVIELEGKATGY